MSADRVSFNLTSFDVAKDFKVAVKTARRWARLNKVPAIKVGDEYRFNREAIIRSFGNKFAKSL